MRELAGRKRTRVVALAALIVALAAGVALGATAQTTATGRHARDGAPRQPAHVHGEDAGRVARVQSGAGGGLRHAAGDSVHAASVRLDQLRHAAVVGPLASVELVGALARSSIGAR